MAFSPHTRLVRSLYKRSLRTTLDWYFERAQFRFQAVLLRQRFEENRNVKDMEKARQLIADGEKELFENQHYQPIKFPNSPGGVAYGREVTIPDGLLDYWHPLEKAEYPEYFARREQRKKEYIKYWESQYGKAEESDAKH